MAAKRPISVTITGDYNDRDVNRAIRDLNSLKKQAGGTTPIMGKLGGAMTAMIGAFAGGAVIGKVVDFLKEAAQNALEDEKAARRLAVAMENLNLAAAIPGVEDGIDRMARATGIADDELRPAFQKLIQATGDVDTAQSALATALDISVGSGKDLQTISLALSKAYNGQTTSLQRLGIPLSSQLLASKDMVAIQKELNRVFGGQAAAAAATYEGQISRVTIAVDEAKEAIGYALLNALSDVNEALGGTDGITGTVDEMGEGMAGLVTGIGELTVSITSAVNALRGYSAEAQGVDTANQDSTNSFSGLVQMIPIVGTYLTILTNRGIDANAETEALATSTAGATNGMRSMGGAADETATEVANLAEELADINAQVANTSAYLNFRKALNDIADAIDKNGTALNGYGDASIANKQMILSVFSEAQEAAQKWAEANGKTSEQAAAKYKQFAIRARQELIDNGFKKKDINAFLGESGLWEETASKGGFRVGVALGEGLAEGIRARTNLVNNEMARLVKVAEERARAELGINSPSKVFIGIGKGIPEGLAIGIRSNGGKADKATTDLMKKLLKGVDVTSKSLGKDLRKNFFDWYKDQEDTLSDALQTAKDKYDDEIVAPLEQSLEAAKGRLENFADGVRNTITGMINFRDAVPTADVFDPDGNLEQSATTFLGNLRAQRDKIVAFTAQIRQLIAMGLNEQSIQDILSAGADAGGAIATELINGGTSAVNETNALVDSINTAADGIATDGSAAWYQAGVDLAQSQLDGAKSLTSAIYAEMVGPAQQAYDNFINDFGPGKPKRQQILDMIDDIVKDAKSKGVLKLDVKLRPNKIKKMINQIFKDAGVKDKDLPFQGNLDDTEERAMGGPVWQGRPYIVGEKGPELFVPSQSGTIVPNGATMGGGAVINLNITAGMGTDGAEVGRQIVDALKKYERRNGPVWVSA